MKDALHALYLSAAFFVIAWVLTVVLLELDGVHQMVVSGIIYSLATLVAFLAVLAANRFFNPSEIKLDDGTLTLRFRSGKATAIPLMDLCSVEIRKRRFSKDTMHIRITWIDRIERMRRKQIWLLVTEESAGFIQKNVQPMEILG